jgi:lysine decarboxylase
MASLDAARRQLAVHGEALLERTIAASSRARRAIDDVVGCAVLGEDSLDLPGVAAWDPLRIVIDVRGTGCTGYEVAAALRGSYDIYVELAAQATLVLILGIGQPVEPLERFTHDFAETVRRISRPGDSLPIGLPPGAFEHDTVVAPREAFLGESEALPVEQAIGRISAETIAGYPPGIPALLPGERVTGEIVAYLRAVTAAGARLHGAADPTFETVRVVRATPGDPGAAADSRGQQPRAASGFTDRSRSGGAGP